MPLRLGRGRASASSNANASSPIPCRTLLQVQRDASDCHGHNPDREQALNEVVQLYKSYNQTTHDVEIMSERSNYTRRSLEKYTLEGLESELGKVTPEWNVAQHNHSMLRGPHPTIESQYKYWQKRFKRFDTMIRVWKSDLGAEAFGTSRDHKPTSEERATLVRAIQMHQNELLCQLCHELDRLYSDEAVEAARASEETYEAGVTARRQALNHARNHRDSNETLRPGMESLAKAQFRPVSRSVDYLVSDSHRY